MARHSENGQGPHDAHSDLLGAFEEQNVVRRERLFEHIFRANEDFQREQRGEPALPNLEYNAVDRENDIHFLMVTLKEMREGPGWKGEEAQAILGAWEDETLQRLESYREEQA
jgi:hypothetical protein